MKLFGPVVIAFLSIACGGGKGGAALSVPLTLDPPGAHQNDGMGHVPVQVAGELLLPPDGLVSVRVSTRAGAVEATMEHGADPGRAIFKAQLPLGTRDLGNFMVRVEGLNAQGQVAAEAETSFAVTAGPSLVCTSPQGLPIESPAQSLDVYGSAFTTTTVVNLNEHARPTTFVSSTHLKVDLGAQDLAVAGLAWITVADAAPGSTTSARRPFSLGAHTTRVVPLPTRDLARHPSGSRLYATIPGDATAYAGCVVALDPSTGGIVASAATGDEPNRLAVAPDGSCLYVGLDSIGAVRRYLLPSLVPDATWVLVPESGWSAMRAMDIQVAPNDMGTFAVSLSGRGHRGSLGYLRIYDASGLRAATPCLGILDTILWALDGNRLYAIDGETTGQEFLSLSLTGGVPNIQSKLSSVNGWGSEIHSSPANGLVYTDSGKVIDPVAMSPAGYFDHGLYSSPRMTLDPDLGLAWFMNTASGSNPSGYAFDLRCMDLNRFTRVGTFTEFCAQWYETSGFGIPLPGRLVRWGTDGLAWGGGGENPGIGSGPFPTFIYLLNGPFVMGR